MRQLWAPWRMAYVGAAGSEAPECFLCRAATEDDDSSLTVERGPLTITLLNRFPYSSGHVMVAPRRHAPDIVALSEAEGSAVFAAAQRAVRAIGDAFHPDGFNLGVNHGKAAGASVEHVHLHVVPRWNGDTNFMPVLGDTKVLPEHLETTAQTLRAAFASLETA